MFGFELGREFKLSIAEIYNLFPSGKMEFLHKDSLILSGITKEEVLEKAEFLGGTIKIFEIIHEFPRKTEFSETIKIISENITKKESGKTNFGLNNFGFLIGNENQKYLLILKKKFKEDSVSGRFVNKNFENISSATVKLEKLLENGNDLNLVNFADGKIFLGKTIWLQDIDKYTKRDFGKKRDMEIGMLPPKLSQIMINLSGNNLTKKKIYDPFCGLGTILIEGILNNLEVSGSDLNEFAVNSTIENLDKFDKEFSLNAKYKIFSADARNISKENLENCDIITEGFLGKIFKKDNVKMDEVLKVREELAELYEGFFKNLKKNKFVGNVIISFPFWEIKGKFIYFEEVYKIIEKYSEIKNVLPINDVAKHTRVGSLLYKRANQVVGREIFKLEIF